MKPRKPLWIIKPFGGDEYEFIIGNTEGKEILVYSQQEYNEIAKQIKDMGGSFSVLCGESRFSPRWCTCKKCSGM